MRPASPSLKVSRQGKHLATSTKAKTAETQRSQLTHRLKHLLHSLQQNPVFRRRVRTHSMQIKVFMHTYKSVAV